MNSQELKKLTELLGEAKNEVTPVCAKGEEVTDFWDLSATAELYRYLEGLAQ